MVPRVARERHRPITAAELRKDERPVEEQRQPEGDAELPELRVDEAKASLGDVVLAQLGVVGQVAPARVVRLLVVPERRLPQ